MQKCKRGLDAFPSLQICACLFILLSVRFKIDLPSRWLESSNVASRRLQSNVISEVESQALFQRPERRLLRGSWIGGNHHRCWMSCDFEITMKDTLLGKKFSNIGHFGVASNQSINWHHHIKGHVEISFFNKFSALKLNRDQVMTLKTWLKIHTNLCNFVTASPKIIYSVFTWRHGGHIGVPKQWNGGHVGVPNQSCGSWILFLCKRFLLFQQICIDAGHLSENTL